MTEHGGRATSLRAGSGLIMISMAVFAGSTYLFTWVATRTLGPLGFSDFSVFWGLLYGLGLGTTLPFEQETSRRVAAEQAVGVDSRDTIRASANAALVVSAGAIVLAAPLCLALMPNPGDAVRLWLVSAAALLGLGTAYVTRGALAGRRQFGRYALQVSSEGVVRIVGAAVLGLLGATSPWTWATLVALALGVAVLLTWSPVWSALRGPAAPTGTTRVILRSLAPLIIASGLGQALINFGPIAVRLLAEPAEQVAAGSFLAAALIARAPTFAFAALQAVLIPRLVSAVVRREHLDLRRILSLTLGATAALGLLGIAVCAIAGPELLHLLSGSEFELSRADITLLGVSTALYLLTLVLQPAALAVQGHRWTAVVWVLAALTFVAATALPLGAVRAVNLAIVAAMSVAVLGLGLVLMRQIPIAMARQD